MKIIGDRGRTIDIGRRTVERGHRGKINGLAVQILAGVVEVVHEALGKRRESRTLVIFPIRKR